MLARGIKIEPIELRWSRSGRGNFEVCFPVVGAAGGRWANLGLWHATHRRKVWCRVYPFEIYIKLTSVHFQALCASPVFSVKLFAEAFQGIELAKNFLRFLVSGLGGR